MEMFDFKLSEMKSQNKKSSRLECRIYEDRVFVSCDHSCTTSAEEAHFEWWVVKWNNEGTPSFFHPFC